MMERVKIEMNISTEKCSKEEVPWDKDVPKTKTTVKIHERYLWRSSAKVTVHLAFLKINSVASISEETWPKFELANHLVGTTFSSQF